MEANESRTSFKVRARLALLQGAPAEAEKHYAELARRYPNDSESLLDLAAAQQGRGDIARAVETLMKVTAIDQHDPRAWFLLGKNTILMGDSRKRAGAGRCFERNGRRAPPAWRVFAGARKVLFGGDRSAATSR